MFEGFEKMLEALERIAEALEEIAESVGRPTELIAEEAPAPDPTAYRDGLKARLDAAGIKYVSKAKTSTLEKLVAEVEANGATPAPVPEPPNVAPPAPPAPAPAPQLAPTEETLVKDDVKDALVALSAAKGKDVALRILAKYAAKLGEVPVEQYPALMADLKEAHNGR